MWDEITYPIQNFNGVTVEVWECISNIIPHFTSHHLSMLWLKLNHVSKRGHWRRFYGTHRSSWPPQMYGCRLARHYDDVIMDVMASQITSLTIVYSTVYSDADQRKHQSSASLAFVWRIHRRPVNSPHKWPVTRKMFPFHDVIMKWSPINIWHNSLKKNAKQSSPFYVEG